MMIMIDKASVKLAKIIWFYGISTLDGQLMLYHV